MRKRVLLWGSLFLIISVLFLSSNPISAEEIRYCLGGCVDEPQYGENYRCIQNETKPETNTCKCRFSVDCPTGLKQYEGTCVPCEPGTPPELCVNRRCTCKVTCPTPTPCTTCPSGKKVNEKYCTQDPAVGETVMECTRVADDKCVDIAWKHCGLIDFGPTRKCAETTPGSGNFDCVEVQCTTCPSGKKVNERYCSKDPDGKDIVMECIRSDNGKCVDELWKHCSLIDFGPTRKCAETTPGSGNFDCVEVQSTSSPPASGTPSGLTPRPPCRCSAGTDQYGRCNNGICPDNGNCEPGYACVKHLKPTASTYLKCVCCKYGDNRSDDCKLP